MRPAKERFYEFMQYAKDSDEWIHQSIQDYVSELEEVNADMLEALIEDTRLLVNHLEPFQFGIDGAIKIKKTISDAMKKTDRPVAVKSWQNMLLKINAIESATGLPIEEVLK